MQEYVINVNEIEELQTIQNTRELDAIFYRAQQTLVGGERVILVRKTAGKAEAFDVFTTLDELAQYKKQVYKYLP